MMGIIYTKILRDTGSFSPPTSLSVIFMAMSKTLLNPLTPKGNRNGPDGTYGFGIL